MHVHVCVCVCMHVLAYVCVHEWMLSCSIMSDSATPWTIARQAPLSMRFSRQEYWSGLPCPPPGGSPWPRDQACDSCVSCTGRHILYHSAPWEAWSTDKDIDKTKGWSLESCLGISQQLPNWWAWKAIPGAWRSWSPLTRRFFVIWVSARELDPVQSMSWSSLFQHFCSSLQRRSCLEFRSEAKESKQRHIN